MGLKEDLDLLMNYPRIKTISYGEFPGKESASLVHIEFYPPPAPKPEVQVSTLPMTDDMPPDDVMMFASSEDVDELMKERKA